MLPALWLVVYIRQAGWWAGDRHVFAKPPECHILVSYQMWFGQKLLKNAKNNSKIVMIW